MNDHSAKGYTYEQILAALELTDNQHAVSTDEIMKDPNKVQLIREYLAKQKVGSSVLDAYRWLSNTLGEYASVADFEAEKLIENHGYRITDEGYVWHPSLLDIFDKAGLPLVMGQSFFKQARIYDPENKKPFYALTYENIEGGKIVLSKSLQCVIGTNDVSLIKGSVYGAGGLHLFKDAFAYLSALLQVNNGRQFKNDAMILNCYSNLNKAAPFIKRYEYSHLYPLNEEPQKSRNADRPYFQEYGYRNVYTWMPNDEQGRHAKKAIGDFLKTEPGLTHTPMNSTYAPYLDISAYHQVKIGLVG